MLVYSSIVLFQIVMNLILCSLGEDVRPLKFPLMKTKRSTDKAFDDFVERFPGEKSSPDRYTLPNKDEIDQSLNYEEDSLTPNLKSHYAKCRIPVVMSKWLGHYTNNLPFCNEIYAVPVLSYGQGPQEFVSIPYNNWEMVLFDMEQVYRQTNRINKAVLYIRTSKSKPAQVCASVEKGTNNMCIASTSSDKHDGCLEYDITNWVHHDMTTRGSTMGLFLKMECKSGYICGLITIEDAFVIVERETTECKIDFSDIWSGSDEV